MNYDIARPVAQSALDVRVQFVKKTYQHLAFAVLAFIVLEYIWFTTPVAPFFASLMLGSRFSWLIVLAAFMGVSWIADNWARSSTSKNTQYMGLGLFVLAESIIFIPLLYIASSFANNIIPMAGIYTILLFLGLTYTAFTTKKDFSFLGGFLKIGGFIALGTIGASIVFGFNLGIIFSIIMVGFAAAAILYDTSNIIRHYHPDQHVAASLSLFASVALLFWYIIQILMSLSSSD